MYVGLAEMKQGPNVKFIKKVFLMLSHSCLHKVIVDERGCHSFHEWKYQLLRKIFVCGRKSGVGLWWNVSNFWRVYSGFLRGFKINFWWKVEKQLALGAKCFKNQENSLKIQTLLLFSPVHFLKIILGCFTSLRYVKLL
jgi:hypothetical protein